MSLIDRNFDFYVGVEIDMTLILDSIFTCHFMLAVILFSNISHTMASTRPNFSSIDRLYNYTDVVVLKQNPIQKYYWNST